MKNARATRKRLSDLGIGFGKRAGCLRRCVDTSSDTGRRDGRVMLRMTQRCRRYRGEYGNRADHGEKVTRLDAIEQRSHEAPEPDAQGDSGHDPAAMPGPMPARIILTIPARCALSAMRTPISTRPRLTRTRRNHTDRSRPPARPSSCGRTGAVVNGNPH